jgi:CheY-like chemotaxis protein
MQPDPEALRGRTILLADDERFRADYVGHAVAGAGATLLGPLCTVQDGQAALERAATTPHAAIVSLRLGDGSALDLVEALAERGVPFLMIGRAGAAPSPLLRGRPHLTQPFAAYQIVDAICDLLAEATPTC